MRTKGSTSKRLCPTCGAVELVTTTERGEYGTKRYCKCKNGHKRTTVEIEVPNHALSTRDVNYAKSQLAVARTMATIYAAGITGE
jgi:hypothetical protein